MARYDYRCTSCGNVFEVEHGMMERPEVSCPACGSAADKVFNASGIKFEGSGFYNTDMRGGAAATSATSGSAAGDSADADAGCSCDSCPHKEH